MAILIRYYDPRGNVHLLSAYENVRQALEAARSERRNALGLDSKKKGKPHNIAKARTLHLIARNVADDPSRHGNFPIAFDIEEGKLLPLSAIKAKVVPN